MPPTEPIVLAPRPGPIPKPRRVSHVTAPAGERPNMTAIRDVVLRVLGEGATPTFGELLKAASCARSGLTAVLRSLQGEQRIVEASTCGWDTGGWQKTRWRLATAADQRYTPPVRSIDAPPCDQADVERAVDQAFASGASVDLEQVYIAVRSKWPQVNRSDVEQLIAQRVAAGAVQKIALGAFVRFRRVAVPA